MKIRFEDIFEEIAVITTDGETPEVGVWYKLLVTDPPRGSAGATAIVSPSGGGYEAAALETSDR